MIVVKKVSRWSVVACALVLTATACGDSDTGAAPDEPISSASENSAVSGQVPAEWKDTPVKVAIYGDAPPGSFVEDGELGGWIPEFSEALAQTSGLDFEIQETASFDVLIPGLTSGRFDMSPALFYITPERLAEVDLISMSKVGTSFGTKNGSDITIEGKDDLCGLTIATLAGSAFPEIIGTVSDYCTQNGEDDIAVQTYPNNSAGSLAVLNDRADAYAATTDQLAYQNEQTGGDFEAQPFIYAERLEAIALPKGSTLGPVMQAGINAMIESGTYAEILEKWGLEEMAIEQSEINPTETIEY